MTDRVQQRSIRLLTGAKHLWCCVRRARARASTQSKVLLCQLQTKRPSCETRAPPDAAEDDWRVCVPSFARRSTVCTGCRTNLPSESASVVGPNRQDDRLGGRIRSIEGCLGRRPFDIPYSASRSAQPSNAQQPCQGEQQSGGQTRWFFYKLDTRPALRLQACAAGKQAFAG